MLVEVKRFTKICRISVTEMISRLNDSRCSDIRPFQYDENLDKAIYRARPIPRAKVTAMQGETDVTCTRGLAWSTLGPTWGGLLPSLLLVSAFMFYRFVTTPRRTLSFFTVRTHQRETSRTRILATN